MYLITIDGTSGSGKSTVARRVAEELDIIYFDSDLLVSAIAVCCIQNSVNPTIRNDVFELLQNNDFKLEIGAYGTLKALVNGVDVAENLRNQLVAANAYSLNKLNCVKAFIIIKQQEMAKKQTMVIDGISSSKYFPDARFKYFLKCDAETRARRKIDALHNRGVHNITYEQILADTNESDKSSFTGESSNVDFSLDTIVIETDNKSAAQVSIEIVKNVRASLG